MVMSQEWLFVSITVRVPITTPDLTFFFMISKYSVHARTQRPKVYGSGQPGSWLGLSNMPSSSSSNLMGLLEGAQSWPPSHPTGVNGLRLLLSLPQLWQEGTQLKLGQTRELFKGRAQLLAARRQRPIRMTMTWTIMSLGWLRLS